MQGLLARVFEVLQQKHVPYCVLRDCEELERFETGGEIDLLVERGHLTQLEALIRPLGFARMPALGHAPHHFYVAYDPDRDAWLKLDVVVELAFGRPTRALCTQLGRSVLAHRRPAEGAFVPAPEDEAMALLLHCTLDKGGFGPKHRARLQELCARGLDVPRMDALLARYWVPGASWWRMAEQIGNGRESEWSWLLEHAPAVRANLTKGQRMGVLVRRLVRPALRKLNRTLPARRGLSMALLAPDGAGKSTLASGVADRFYLPVRSVYMGLYPSNESRPRFLPPGAGFVVRLLRQWGRYLSARYHQTRGRFVIYDRYTYDALLTPRRRLSLGRRARRWVLARACPAPDLVVLLDAPGHVLFARKGEHTADILERQRQEYLSVSARLPCSRVVDATRDAESVLRDVTRLFWSGWSGRLGDRAQEPLA